MSGLEGFCCRLSMFETSVSGGLQFRCTCLDCKNFESHSLCVSGVNDG